MECVTNLMTGAHILDRFDCSGWWSQEPMEGISGRGWWRNFNVCWILGRVWREGSKEGIPLRNRCLGDI